MPRPVPFFFCRYQFLVEEEILDTNGQFQALSDLQGQYFAHGLKAEREGLFDSVVMRPRSVEIDGGGVIFWSVGQKIGTRLAVEYDPDRDELTPLTIDDPSVRYSDFVVIPDLGVLAVDDRSGDNHLGGKAAINRFRSIFRNIDGGAINIELTTTPNDVARALKNWELTEFSFVARPINPHPRSVLSKMLSDEFEKDGIGRYSARARPRPGGQMRPSEDGHIASAIALSEEGYGQYAIKGVTDDGHEAHIKKPVFEAEVQKNQLRQSQPRELRVLIQTEREGEDELFSKVAKALVNFYAA